MPIRMVIRLRSLSSTFRADNFAFCLALFFVILAVTLTYWPVIHAEFVWDDLIDFKRSTWLRYGNDWRHFILSGFNNWTNYFRPLVVALFTLEVRAFDVKPGPMHGVSLIMHIVNSVLVGLLAIRLRMERIKPVLKSKLFALSALVYGLHPLLIEPVVWIGCQFDLLATLLMLLGWTLNRHLANVWVRASAISICFFLAACSKESAIVFPMILVICDWVTMDLYVKQTYISQFSALLKRNFVTYACIAITGVAYLFLRGWAIGGGLYHSSDALALSPRLHEASFLYLNYWRMFFWPMESMSPVHSIDMGAFLNPGFTTWARDALTLIIVTAGILLTLRRSRAGALILSVTLALIPVLHLIAVNFDSSPYHERYAMTALAVACAWLPSTGAELLQRLPISRSTLSVVARMALAIWLVFAVMNIRATIPLWSSQIPLWRWALQQEPNSAVAKEQLLTAYINDRDDDDAWKLIHQLTTENAQCPNCMVSAAVLALREKNLAQAQSLLDKVETEGLPQGDMFRAYMLTKAQLLLLQHNPSGTEQLMRKIVPTDRRDPEPQIMLAVALAMQGKTSEAIEVENTAIFLLPPDQRQRRLQAFMKLVKDNPETPHK